MDQTLIVRRSDGSVETPDGDVIYFSTERFRREICEGRRCFLCGRSAGDTPFTDEHILPRWLLADFELFDKRINLPNGARFNYGRYTIPCCAECNAHLGEKIEGPASRILRGGYDAVASHLETEGTQLLYSWLSLVFLKTHLRDQLFRFHLDRRRPADPLSRDYDWADFHHTHAVARAFFTGCTVEQEALGSFCAFPASVPPHYEHFDYHDLFLAQAALLRIGDVALLAVFDDGHAALSHRYDFLSRIDGPLSPVQLREILAHLAYTNLKLADRPRFYTDFWVSPCAIRARRPREIEKTEHEPEALGRILPACVGHYLDHFRNPDIDDIRAQVRAGNYTFLFDGTGHFIRNSLEPIP